MAEPSQFCVGSFCPRAASCFLAWLDEFAKALAIFFCAVVARAAAGIATERAVLD